MSERTLRDILLDEEARQEDLRILRMDNPPRANDLQFGGRHYKDMKIEPWQVIDTWPMEQQIGYHRGNVLKYTMRMGNKDDRLQEAKKIRHYADKLIEVLERTYGSDTGSKGQS